MQGGIFRLEDNMKTEYGRIGTVQEQLLYEILQELKKLNEKSTPAPKKRAVKKEVKDDAKS
jgi:hypothetical protein